MHARTSRSSLVRSALRLCAASLAAWMPASPVVCHAQAATTASAPSASPQRVSLDHVVAVVNGELILASDLDAEERAAAFQPFRDQGAVTRDQLIDRLIDRDLILQQMKLQTEPPISDVQVDAELAGLRKTIPECAQYHCETDAGWQKFIADQGFTLAELRERWRVRMEVLRFIEERFRMGIRISPAEIDDYYNKTMIPAYRKQNVTPPPEKTVADRIQQILLEQRVTDLLDDWLKALRAQGSVEIFKDGGPTP